MYSVFDLFDQMDDLFDTGADGLRTGAISYAVPSFPPVDVMTDKDGNLIFNFAVVGYKKDDFKISFDEDFLVLSTKDDYKAPDIQDGCKVIRKLIKNVQFNYKYLVPASKFKQEDTTASMADGVLTIKIPPVEKKEKKTIEIA
jgi:HSP20 family molecular chaperone IbpA